MKLLIAGDLVPTEKNLKKFEDENFINYFDENFIKTWNNVDYRILNLECCLGTMNQKIDKNGPCLKASSESINGIKSLNPNLILLSNNHILDYGTEGLQSTIKLLNNKNINYTGIVKNSLEKYKPYYIQKDNIKIGIYNVCENEFSVATEKTEGANSLNEVKNYIEINEAKKECDYIFVIFHGGKEFYRYPSPKLQRICRNFINAGADLVITQHSHCIGTEEIYNNKKIIYGQGNFIFDNDINNEYWNTSLLIEIEIGINKLNIKYIPLEKNNGLVKISKNQNILKDFYQRSEEIKSQKNILTKYSDLANQYLNSYLYQFRKTSLIERALNKFIFKKKYYTTIYKKDNLLQILNILECEAHRELAIQGIKNQINIINRKKERNKESDIKKNYNNM